VCVCEPAGAMESARTARCGWNVTQLSVSAADRPLQREMIVYGVCTSDSFDDDINYNATTLE